VIEPEELCHLLIQRGFDLAGWSRLGLGILPDQIYTLPALEWVGHDIKESTRTIYGENKPFLD